MKHSATHSTSCKDVHSPRTSLLVMSLHRSQLSSAKLIVHKLTPAGAVQTRTVMPATISVSEQTQIGSFMRVVNQRTSFCRGICRGMHQVPRCIQHHIRRSSGRSNSASPPSCLSGSKRSGVPEHRHAQSMSTLLGSLSWPAGPAVHLSCSLPLEGLTAQTQGCLLAWWPRLGAAAGACLWRCSAAYASEGCASGPTRGGACLLCPAFSSRDLPRLQPWGVGRSTLRHHLPWNHSLLTLGTAACMHNHIRLGSLGGV